MSDRPSDAAEREAALQRAMFPDLPEFPIEPERTALVVIDMQYLDAHPDYGLGRKARDACVWGVGRSAPAWREQNGPPFWTCSIVARSV